jgi:16S rRNA (adenine1518-N6/adenine1519-N6)-dimethyltransferase
MRHGPERFRPRRRWGQNFLVNAGAIDAIVAALGPDPSDRVLEIGPGSGALTRRLIGRVEALTAIEIDPHLAAGLGDELAAHPTSTRVTIVQGDILDRDVAALLTEMGASPRHPARVLGNLPYNIATTVILRLLTERSLLSDLLVMVQREVAARILSPPGRKTYGGLSVLCQAFAKTESVIRLKPGSFRPRPRVESEVVRLILRDPGGAAAENPAALSDLLRLAFAHRRKKLLNNLAARLGGRRSETLLRAAALDPAVRPEGVSVDGFLALLKALHGGED